MAGSNKAILAGLLLGIISVILAGQQDLQSAPEILPGPQLHERLLAASVWIHANDKGQGTGFFIRATRPLVLTNFHVVGDNPVADVWLPTRTKGELQSDRTWYLQHRQELISQGRLITGKVIRTDKAKDLALIELPDLPAGIKPLDLAATPPQPGDGVSLLGCRYDVPTLWTLGQGSIRLIKTLREGYYNSGQKLGQGVRIIQANVPINEGDSGAALVDSWGNLIGVASAIAWEHRGDGYFIHASEVSQFLDEKKKDPLPPVKGSGDVYRKGVRSSVLILPASIPIEPTKETGIPARGRSSGVVIDQAKRLIITTSEGTANKKEVFLYFPIYRREELVAEVSQYGSIPRPVRGVVLAQDPVRNLALVEADAIPESSQEVTRAEKLPEIGETAHSIGNPERIDMLWIYGNGLLRQKGRSRIGTDREDPEVEVFLLQMTASEGDGGGPLLNSNGELIGIQSGHGTPQQQVSYALTLRELDQFLETKKSSWQPQKTSDLVSRAKLFLSLRRPARALADLKEALGKDTTSAAARIESSKAWEALGKKEKAMEDALKAIEYSPQLSEAYSQCASLFWNRKSIKKAMEYADRALELDKNNQQAYLIRGLVFLQKNQFDRAREDLDQSIWHARESPAGFLARGKLLQMQEKWEEAQADYQQAITLDPENPEGYRLRGSLYWSRSNLQASLTDYERALTLNPEDPLALLGRSRIHWARKEKTLAWKDLERSLQIEPKRPEGHILKGEFLIDENKLDLGLEAFLTGLKTDPETVSMVFLLLQKTLGKKPPSADDIRRYRLFFKEINSLDGIASAIKKQISEAIGLIDEKMPDKAVQQLKELASQPVNRLPPH